MRGTSDEEDLLAKEADENLADTHGARVCDYRAENISIEDTQFKESVQTYGQQISYCGVGSNHQNAIVEYRIKKLTLVSRTLLLHATRMWPGAESTILCPFSFKASCHMYISLEIDEDGKTPEQKFSGVEF